VRRERQRSCTPGRCNWALAKACLYQWKHQWKRARRTRTVLLRSLCPKGLSIDYRRKSLSHLSPFRVAELSFVLACERPGFSLEPARQQDLPWLSCDDQAFYGRAHRCDGGQALSLSSVPRDACLASWCGHD